MNAYFLPQYAARAIVDLEQTHKAIRGLGRLEKYAWAVLEVAALIRSAVHVVLPSDGEIYRGNDIEREPPTKDECDSFSGLPAPATCFQYPWTHIDPNRGSAVDEAYAPKRITLVIDGKQIADSEAPKNAVYTATFFSVFFDERYKQWQLADMSCLIKQPLEISRDTDRWGWIGAARNLKTWEYFAPENTPSKQLGEMAPDLTAVVQCCHALRAGARFDEAVEQSPSRRHKFERLGVGGFTYHVLTIPKHTERNIDSTASGHSSPRLHVRRAHIRKLPTGSLTFVRQCFVGDPRKGTVEKHYKVASG